MNKESAGGFKANVFGGFNRQDVLDHIEQLYRQLGEYEVENAVLKERCEQLEERLEQAQCAGQADSAHVVPRLDRRGKTAGAVKVRRK